ncbi:CGNR zinc finger domain-containing protein [Streptomyces olivaceoviridis]|uniref:CGNR zinc finger domain-containing protein n=1 Tax=Streptomyces olivaceoviridis TaxID=1921 RepID=UPI0033ADDA0F
MEAIWQATERYGLASAPGALALVQDLLNTVSAGRPREADLLADVSLAQGWLDAARDAWTATTGRAVPEVRLEEEDVVRLRDVRRAVRDSMTPPGGSTERPGEDSPVPVLETANVALEFAADGTVTAAPRGGGSGYLVAMLLLALWQAQSDGERRRLKLCRNPRCSVAFYDRSRNNSGVWHDVRTCGNAANLRAFRARASTTGADRT